MMRALLKLGGSFALIAMALGGCAQEAPADVTVISYASLYPPQHPFSLADQEWIEFVERESNGQVVVRPFWSGSLVSSEQNMIEARHEIADVVMITPMYAKAAPLQRIQSSFYRRTESVLEQVELYRCMSSRFPALDQELGPLRILAVQGGNLPGLLTRDRPVRRLEDLRGLRLRTQRDMAEIVRSFGADPVDMPMADVYSAMARHVIDGVIAPTDALYSMHLAEVGNYFTQIDIPRGAYPARAISNRRFAQLPQSVRDLLERSERHWEAAIARQVEGALDRGKAAGAAEGVEFIALAPSEDDRLQQLYSDHSFELAMELQARGIPAEEIIKASWAVSDQAAATGALNCGAPVA